MKRLNNRLETEDWREKIKTTGWRLEAEDCREKIKTIDYRLEAGGWRERNAKFKIKNGE